jgi:4-diphosphocytidyl-2-C-methyl-D-erythritol kinase
MLFRCYAKINLSLEIVGKRPDGFHELASLVHTVSLGDELHLTLTHEPRTRVEVEGLDIDPSTNLVWRAAELLRTRVDTKRGADIRLSKRIPAAAGLGGGSSDAAATLVGLNRLWATQLATQELQNLAAEVGSDVPFFVRGGAALMRGRGDRLEVLSPLKGQWLVLLAPGHTVADKTRRLYAALEPRDLSSGDMTLRAVARLKHGELLPECELVNAFERAARQVFPGLEEMWHAAERLTSKRFLLSGAGPALFALAASRFEARRLAARLESLGAPVYALRMVGHARTSLRRAAIEYA